MEPSPQMIENMMTVIRLLRLYHRHQVLGLENIPRKGPGILVCNHSFATYDMSLLFCVIYDRLKRLPRSLADHLFFKIPLLGELVEASGAREGTPENARGLLEAQELVSVAPGGMREALRPSQERYQVLWEHRKGFVKLALETQTPIILAFCPKADDLYDVYSSPLTQWAYQTFKIPVPLIRGLGPTFIPKPIALTHFIDKPIQPPLVTKDKRRRAGQLDRFHGEVLKKAQELMARAVAHRGASSW